MNNRINSKLILILFIILFSCIIAISSVSDNSFSNIKNISNYTVFKFQKVIDKFLYLFQKQDSSDNLINENKLLKIQNKKLKIKNKLLKIQIEEYKDKNKLYKQLNDNRYFVDKYNLIHCKVVGKSLINLFSTFIINKGFDSGIRKGMNVVGVNGLIGIVSKVYKNYSIITNIKDSNLYIGSKEEKTNELCIVNGSLNFLKNGRLKFFKMKNNIDICIGDKIVTSNISSKYYENIPIGYISKIKKNNLTLSGEIVPFENLNNIQDVFIIKNLKNND